MTHKICYDFCAKPIASGANRDKLNTLMSIDNSTTCRCALDFAATQSNSTTCTLPAGGNTTEVGGGRDSVSVWRLNPVRRFSLTVLRSNALRSANLFFTTKVSMGKYDCALAQPQTMMRRKILVRYTHTPSCNAHCKPTHIHMIEYGDKAWICGGIEWQVPYLSHSHNPPG
jgi:hypothetical protein